MNLQQMRLSEQALSKLSQLALAVEMHERRRFSLRKDVDQVLSLLKVALDSGKPMVQQKLGELIDALTPDAIGFFRTLGVSLSLPKPVNMVSGQQTYRGQVINKAPAGRSRAASSQAEESTKKKKIIYRGKVIYR